MGFADGNPRGVYEMYVSSFDHNGRGKGVYTKDPHGALVFGSSDEARSFWEKKSSSGVRTMKIMNIEMIPLELAFMMWKHRDKVLR